jgi:hypothetical protein
MQILGRHEREGAAWHHGRMRKPPIRVGGKNLRREKPGDYIGFIGCDQVGLLPVRMAASRQSMRVVCPHCGELHVTSDPMPRLRRPGEIVTLIEDGMPMAVTMPADVGSDAEVADDADEEIDD